MGYAQDAKGYLIWFPSNRSLRVRRDVIFHDMPQETKAPIAFGPHNNMWDDILMPNWRRTLDQGRVGEDASVTAERSLPGNPEPVTDDVGPREPELYVLKMRLMQQS